MDHRDEDQFRALAGFPHLDAYLARLPDGLDSYPQCKAKGSMVRSALEGHDFSDALSSLPDALVELIESPPPATRWVPLVHAESLFHLACDCYYPTQRDAIDWTYRRTIAMAKSPMYRGLVTLVGPRFLLKTATAVHGLFEKGTTAKVSLGEKSARVRLAHPPHVHSPLNQASNLGLFRAIVELTGATLIDAHVVETGADGATIDIVWE